MTGSPARTGANLGGRPAATSAHKLAEVAQELFLDKGFSETSVDDIAAAAGVSGRTFFRYFATKADVLWINTPIELDRVREGLEAAPAGERYQDTLCLVVPTAYVHSPRERVWALQRAELVIREPAVQAPMSPHLADFRDVVAAFVARRLDCDPADMVPVAVSASALSATMTAHEYWVSHPSEDLPSLIERMLRLMLPRLDGV
ncbi:acyl-CoA-like ligand-binding transcription factor [Prauserella cavernicola]|uniref:TetR family transcriptional regulator n=1 Tax=Prauserella cavernicola TaxID=2800127 RepID=A0A934V7C7_9PSEU|nr:TetR family transcriptional regulator [Prauserella cavernicola]MBK1787105.1 TetR family transcriptional regulator [Prauserella cavernicola]